MSDTATVTPTPPSYIAVEDDRFLNGVDLDSPASVARAIAMQIRVVGHYQGQAEQGGACLVASAAHHKMNLEQRIRFTNALREHIGNEARSSGFSLVWWNDHTRTEVVVDRLETLPLGAGGGCDR